MWTIDFEPDKPGSNIGAIVLTNGAFVFRGSVNLEHPDSARKMMEVAKESKTEAEKESQLSAKYQQVLDELTVEMNK